MSEFWQDVRQHLMVRGDGWKAIIDELPQVMSQQDAKQLLQTHEQLIASGFPGMGYVNGEQINSMLPSQVFSALEPAMLNFDNCAMQWTLRFFVVEGLCEHWRKQPLAEWPPAHVDLVVHGFHFMVYMAALMCLFEEGGMPPLSTGLLEYTEVDVKHRVTQMCQTLYSKTQDYGESFRRHGLPGVIPRLWDKIARIAQLKADNRRANFERLLDSVQDLLGYTLIAFSLLMELPESVRTRQTVVVEEI